MEASSPKASSPKDFSFGTTHPLQLPAALPAAPAEMQVEALDEEFTFGATKPLALPDMSHVPKDYGQGSGTAPLEWASPQTRSLGRSSPGRSLGAPASPSIQSLHTSRSRFSGHGLHKVSPDQPYQQQIVEPSQVLGNWSPGTPEEAITPYLASQVAVAGYQCGAPLVMQAAHAYAMPAAGNIAYGHTLAAHMAYGHPMLASPYAQFADDILSKPAGTLPAIPCDMHAPQSMLQDYPSGAGTPGALAASLDLDSAKSNDPEMGSDEAVGDDSLCIPELESRPSWRVKAESLCLDLSPARRVAAALVMFLLVICIVALIAIVSVDSGEPTPRGKSRL